MTRKLLMGLICAVLNVVLYSTWVCASGGELPRLIASVATTSPVYVTSVTINKSSLSLVDGESSQLTATVNPTNADNKNVRWLSTDTGVASVDSGGFVFAKDVGTCEIKVYTEDGHYKDTVKVTVKEKEIDLRSMSFSETAMVMDVGDTYTVKYTLYPEDATNKKVSWKSSDTAVATVSSSGIVTAKAQGTCKITGTTSDSAYTDTLVITVNPLPVYPFSDISRSPYKAEIFALYGLGVVQGSEEKYRPSDVVTRAELASMLTKGLKLSGSTANSRFSDVQQPAWYFGSVLAVESRHILYGYPDGTFRPSKTVSLEEAAAVISRLFVPEETLKYRTVYNKNFTCSTWANVYVDYAVKEGLVDVAKIATFNRNAKREEIAYMFYNVLRAQGVITTD